MEHCKGCCIRYICIYTKYSETCPCTTCIIKMICKQICPERIDFPNLKEEPNHNDRILL